MTLICIDAGHSGQFEPGACSMGHTEANLNLKMARLLQDELMKYSGLAVMLTRCGEVYDDEMDWRCDMANDADADLFISIHHNAFEDANAKGTEVYYFTGSEQGELFARSIYSAIYSDLKLHYGREVNRGTKSAGFYVLKHTAMTAALIEYGFMTNAEDMSILTSEKGAAILAAATAKGIYRYITNINI